MFQIEGIKEIFQENDGHTELENFKHKFKNDETVMKSIEPILNSMNNDYAADEEVQLDITSDHN